MASSSEVGYMPKTFPIIVDVHGYQPPSVIIPGAIQTGFNLTFALSPTVTVKSGNLLLKPSSLLMNAVVLIEIC